MAKYVGPPPIPEMLVTGPLVEETPNYSFPELLPDGVWYEQRIIPPPPEGVTSEATYPYRDACILNGWDPELPPVTLFNGDELESRSGLPGSSEERKNIPLCTGVLDYFPAALAEVAKASKAGNDQHNPGEDLHWARGKSMDHANCILRHLADRGGRDSKGIRHSAYLAWRALALLQMELEADGAPLSRASR